MRPAVNGRDMGKKSTRGREFLAYSQFNIRAETWDSTHSAILLDVEERGSPSISPTMLIMRFLNSSLQRYYRDISPSDG